MGEKSTKIWIQNNVFLQRTSVERKQHCRRHHEQGLHPFFQHLVSYLIILLIPLFDPSSALVRAMATPKAPSSLTYDLVIVGGGSAGLTAAKLAGKTLKKSTLIVEVDRLGGDCTWTGMELEKLHVPSNVSLYCSPISQLISLNFVAKKVAFLANPSWPVPRQLRWLENLLFKPTTKYQQSTLHKFKSTFEPISRISTNEKILPKSWRPATCTP